MTHLLSLYRRAALAFSSLQSLMLLAVRLYWGFQFSQTGWGKLHNLVKITGFFASLNIPFAGFSAPFVSVLEFVGVGSGLFAVDTLIAKRLKAEYL